MEGYVWIIALVGTTFAGAINTLAGNGSAITLTMLTELMGLPGNVANATNRVGILLQTTAGGIAFYRNGRLNLQRSEWYLIFSSIGAIAGTVVAIRISNEQFREVFKFLMVFLLLLILVKPERWLHETDTTRKPNWWLAGPLFMALGFYGGFIQMGMGLFFLAAMVLGARYSMIDANALKAVVVGVIQVVAVAGFWYKGLIDWKIGVIMAIGQTAGGYFTAHYASRFPEANIWAHRLLVVVVILSLAHLFKILPGI
jgi:uncharacterized membrane protein YfcA